MGDHRDIIISRTRPQEWSSRWKYQKEALSLVLREDVDANPVAEPACAASVPCHLIVNQMDSVIPAAMVFDRAASHKP